MMALKLRPCTSWLRTVGSTLVLMIGSLCLLFATSLAHSQTFAVLHAFKGRGDGKFPTVGVIRDSAGNLYGTTNRGGALDMGTLFRLDTNGNEIILHNFWGGDGLGPGELMRTHSGTLFGTTGDGGTAKGGGCQYGCGTVFKLDTADKHKVLYIFKGGGDGSGPWGPLVRDAEGNFYGATEYGGDLSCGQLPPPGCGVVFRVDTSGKETVLYTFTGGDDGGFPTGGVIRDDAGNLYGAAGVGGTFGSGVIFRLDPAGHETVLYNFTGYSDGGGPWGPLLRDSAGNLYGTTFYGGYSRYSGGVVFMLDTGGGETVLHDFGGGNDGWAPDGGLVRDRKGNLFGTTGYGGSNGCNVDGCGIVFKVDVNGNETMLHVFTGKSDGQYPNARLTLDESGNIYGTAAFGGDSSCGDLHGLGCGVVFKITP
jgi:uncharacterized repeat protein (TIGR03803 family)